MKIQILRNNRGQWFWRLLAGNNKVLAHSESYSGKNKARKTAWTVWEQMTSGNCSVEETE